MRTLHRNLLLPISATDIHRDPEEPNESPEKETRRRSRRRPQKHPEPSSSRPVSSDDDLGMVPLLVHRRPFDTGSQRTASERLPSTDHIEVPVPVFSNESTSSTLRPEAGEFIPRLLGDANTRDTSQHPDDSSGSAAHENSIEDAGPPPVDDTRPDPDLDSTQSDLPRETELVENGPTCVTNDVADEPGDGIEEENVDVSSPEPSVPAHEEDGSEAGNSDAPVSSDSTRVRSSFRRVAPPKRLGYHRLGESYSLAVQAQPERQGILTHLRRTLLGY